MERLDNVMKHLKCENTIILGDLNDNFSSPKDERTEKIVESLKTYDMIDLSTRYKQKRNKPYTWTWKMHREGKDVKSICDYILTGKNITWKSIKVIDTLIDTYHRLIEGILWEKLF